MDLGEKVLAVERFDEKSEGPGGHYGRLCRRIFVTSDKDRPRIWGPGTEMREQFHPRHSIHPDIQHHHRDRIGGEIFEEQRWVAKTAHT